MTNEHSRDRSTDRFEERHGLRHKYQRWPEVEDTGDYGVGNDGLAAGELVNEGPDILDQLLKIDNNSSNDDKSASATKNSTQWKQVSSTEMNRYIIEKPKKKTILRGR